MAQCIEGRGITQIRKREERRNQNLTTLPHNESQVCKHASIKRQIDILESSEEVAFPQALQLLQRVLMAQCSLIKQEIHCVSDFEPLLKELWTLYINLLPDKSAFQLLPLSLWPSLNVTLAIIYQTFVLLRYPIMIMDICNWVDRAVLPYQNVQNIVPIKETATLPIRYKKWFNLQRTPPLPKLRGLMQDMAVVMSTRMKIIVPTPPEERIFIRIHQGLRLSPEAYLFRDRILNWAYCRDLRDYLEHLRRTVQIDESNETILVGLAVTCILFWLSTLETTSLLSTQYRSMWTQADAPIQGNKNLLSATDDEILSWNESQIVDFLAAYSRAYVPADDKDVLEDAKEASNITWSANYTTPEMLRLIPRVEHEEESGTSRGLAIDSAVLTTQIKQIFDCLPDEELIMTDPPSIGSFSIILMQRASDMYGIPPEGLDKAVSKIFQAISGSCMAKYRSHTLPTPPAGHSAFGLKSSQFRFRVS